MYMVRDILDAGSRQNFSLIPQWQGTTTNPMTEEEPDRFSHQVFRVEVDGKRIPQEQVDTAAHWAGVWQIYQPGTPFTGFVVYNSADGAGRYLTALGDYVAKHGRDVLGDSFTHHATGETRTVADAAIRGANWIASKIEASPEGLFEMRATNPHQTSWSGVMRDGDDSYYHPTDSAGNPLAGNGMALNRNERIAYLAEQARAYDSLLIAAHLFPDNPNAQRWLAAAEGLPEATKKHFWVEDGKFNFLACAVDVDPVSGQRRPVRLKSLEALEAFDSDLFNQLPKHDYQRIFLRVVSEVFTPEWMTVAGPTMTHPQHARTDGYVSYQGCQAVWGNIVGSCERALTRQGWNLHAHELRERYLKALDRSGGAPEIWFADLESTGPWGRQIIGNAHEAAARFADVAGTPGTSILPTASLPTEWQGWSASAGQRMACEELRYNSRLAHERAHGSGTYPDQRATLQKTRYVRHRGNGSSAVIDTQDGRSKYQEVVKARAEAAAVRAAAAAR